MIINKIFKVIDIIKKNITIYLKNNFSHKVIDALEILLLSFFVITLVYFIFVAFTEILLLLILFILIMIYRKI